MISSNFVKLTFDYKEADDIFTKKSCCKRHFHINFYDAFFQQYLTGNTKWHLSIFSIFVSFSRNFFSRMRTSLLLLAVVGTALAEVYLEERFDKGKIKGQITLFDSACLYMWQKSAWFDEIFTFYLQMIGHLNGFNLHIREPKRENLNGLPENSTETLIKIRYVFSKFGTFFGTHILLN